MMVTSGARRLARAAIVLAALAVAGCGQLGNPLKTIRGQIPPPDEFQVIAREPIQMPPDYSLPEPTPGTVSPLEPDPHADAVSALTGRPPAGASGSATTSTGEAVLLSSANAAASSSEIRVQLEEDKIKSEKNKPYEPPSLFEVLGLTEGKTKVDEKELIDPVAESQRLQTAGNVAPSDPRAKPEEAEAPEPPPIYPTQRPTRDPIANPNVAPAN